MIDDAVATDDAQWWASVLAQSIEGSVARLVFVYDQRVAVVVYSQLDILRELARSTQTAAVRGALASALHSVHDALLEGFWIVKNFPEGSAQKVSDCHPLPSLVMTELRQLAAANQEDETIQQALTASLLHAARQAMFTDPAAALAAADEIEMVAGRTAHWSSDFARTYALTLVEAFQTVEPQSAKAERLVRRFRKLSDFGPEYLVLLGHVLTMRAAGCSNSNDELIGELRSVFDKLCPTAEVLLTSTWLREANTANRRQRA